MSGDLRWIDAVKALMRSEPARALQILEDIEIGGTISHHLRALKAAALLIDGQHDAAEAAFRAVHLELSTAPTDANGCYVRYFCWFAICEMAGDAIGAAQARQLAESCGAERWIELSLPMHEPRGVAQL